MVTRCFAQPSLMLAHQSVCFVVNRTEHFFGMLLDVGEK